MNSNGNTLEDGAPFALPSKSSQDPSQTFTLFPELPVELRIVIWEFATLLIEPRTFRITIRRGVEGKDKFWLIYPNCGQPHPSYNKACARRPLTRMLSGRILLGEIALAFPEGYSSL
jgi:hypothetical protein